MVNRNRNSADLAAHLVRHDHLQRRVLRADADQDQHQIQACAGEREIGARHQRVGDRKGHVCQPGHQYDAQVRVVLTLAGPALGEPAAERETEGAISNTRGPG